MTDWTVYIQNKKVRIKKHEQVFWLSSDVATSQGLLQDKALVQRPKKLFSFASLGKLHPKVTQAHVLLRKQHLGSYASDIKGRRKPGRQGTSLVLHPVLTRDHLLWTKTVRHPWSTFWWGMGIRKWLLVSKTEAHLLVLKNCPFKVSLYFKKFFLQSS